MIRVFSGSDLPEEERQLPTGDPLSRSHLQSETVGYNRAAGIDAWTKDDPLEEDFQADNVEVAGHLHVPGGCA